MNLHHLHVYQLFPDKELNHFYSTVTLNALGDGIISIFVPIFLFQSGYSIVQIILFYFILFVAMTLFAHPGARITERIGPKHAMLASVPFVIFFYVGFIFLGENSWLFYILPILFACRATLYNFGYHFHIIPHLDGKHEGSQLSTLAALVLIANIIGPLIGGIIATNFHFSALYIIASIIFTCATFPLFLTKDSRIEDGVKLSKTLARFKTKKDQGVAISNASYAVESILDGMIWPIYLIIILGTPEKTGAIVSLALAISITVIYITGKLTDKFDKQKLLRISSVVYAFGWFLRLFASNTSLILIADSYKNMAQRLLYIPWTAYNYDLAKKTSHINFTVFREFIFHGTRILFLPFLMLIFYLDVHPFKISFALGAIVSVGYMAITKKNKE